MRSKRKTAPTHREREGRLHAELVATREDAASARAARDANYERAARAESAKVAAEHDLDAYRSRLWAVEYALVQSVNETRALQIKERQGALVATLNGGNWSAEYALAVGAIADAAAKP